MQPTTVFTQVSISGKWNVDVFAYLHCTAIFQPIKETARRPLQQRDLVRPLSVSPTKHRTRPTLFMNNVHSCCTLFINPLQPAEKSFPSTVGSWGMTIFFPASVASVPLSLVVIRQATLASCQWCPIANWWFSQVTRWDEWGQLKIRSYEKHNASDRCRRRDRLWNATASEWKYKKVS